MNNIDVVWERICKNEGNEFQQIRGKIFTYSIKGNTVFLTTTNRSFSKGEIQKALEFVPIKSTASINHLQAPSYLYAILMDDRIRESLW